MSLILIAPDLLSERRVWRRKRRGVEDPDRVSGKERVPEIPDQLSSSKQQKRFTLHSSEEANPSQASGDRQTDIIHTSPGHTP